MLISIVVIVKFTNYLSKKLLKVGVIILLIVISVYIRYYLVISHNLHNRFLEVDFDVTNDPTFIEFYVYLYEPTWARFGTVVVGVLAAYLLHYYRDKVSAVLNNTLVSYIAFVWSCLIIFSILSSPGMNKENPVPPETLLFGLAFGSHMFATAVTILMLSCLVLNENSSFPIRVMYSFLNLKVFIYSIIFSK